MKCPFCQQPNTLVTDSRLTDEGSSIRRRRRCPSCDKRFITTETLDVRLPDIIKSNGSRVPYNAHKLRTSLERALHKRPFGSEDVDDLVAKIEVHKFRIIIYAVFGKRSVNKFCILFLSDIGYDLFYLKLRRFRYNRYTILDNSSLSLSNLRERVPEHIDVVKSYLCNH